MNNKLHIKFRAWDKKRNEMITDAIEYEIRLLDLPCPDNEAINSEIGFFEDTDGRLFNIMQFTGLKDCNDKEIYEGDICTFIISENFTKYNPIEASYVVIEWKNACWGFTPLYPELVHKDDQEWSPFYVSEAKRLWNPKHFNIIGNIYKNPELMQCQQN